MYFAPNSHLFKLVYFIVIFNFFFSSLQHVTYFFSNFFNLIFQRGVTYGVQYSSSFYFIPLYLSCCLAIHKLLTLAQSCDLGFLKIVNNINILLIYLKF